MHTVRRCRNSRHQHWALPALRRARRIGRRIPLRRTLGKGEWNMPLRSNANVMQAICGALSCFALIFAFGCAPAARRTANAGSMMKPPVNPPTSFVDVQRDAGGVTFTQHVSVTDEVRGDSATAVRMLEEAQYERAIALLLKVTER